MKPILYTPCSSNWVLSDIIFVYMLEPSSISSVKTENLIQNAAGSLAGRKLVNTALKRVIASNVLLLVSAVVIAGSLRYAIKRYKEIRERKKAAVLSQIENKTGQPTIIIPALSRSQVEKPKPTIICN
jgi:hypothetical protein